MDGLVLSRRGHQARVPSRAVTLGTRKIGVTKAEIAIPTATEKPIFVSRAIPASISWRGSVPMATTKL
jgi:hypothetical protein